MTKNHTVQYRKKGEPTLRYVEIKGKFTLMVFLKFFGSSWSSNGYAPTSITYRVTPQDHTSAN